MTQIRVCKLALESAIEAIGHCSEIYGEFTRKFQSRFEKMNLSEQILSLQILDQYKILDLNTVFSATGFPEVCQYLIDNHRSELNINEIDCNIEETIDTVLYRLEEGLCLKETIDFMKEMKKLKLELLKNNGFISKV
jgi:hypothetical protein